jgi:hypothetical protein
MTQWNTAPLSAVTALEDYFLGTIEGALLLALLLTVIFMVGYVAWRRRKKK